MPNSRLEPTLAPRARAPQPRVVVRKPDSYPSPDQTWPRKLARVVRVWIGMHRATVAIAALIGLASGIWSATFPDYSTGEAIATGAGVFIFSREFAYEF